jgi:hypothetical protein
MRILESSDQIFDCGDDNPLIPSTTFHSATFPSTTFPSTTLRSVQYNPKYLFYFPFWSYPLRQVVRSKAVQNNSKGVTQCTLWYLRRRKGKKGRRRRRRRRRRKRRRRRIRRRRSWMGYYISMQYMHTVRTVILVPLCSAVHAHCTYRHIGASVLYARTMVQIRQHLL